MKRANSGDIKHLVRIFNLKYTYTHTHTHTLNFVSYLVMPWVNWAVMVYIFHRSM